METKTVNTKIPTQKELNAFMLKYAYEGYGRIPKDAEWSDKIDCYVVPNRKKMTLRERQIAKYCLPWLNDEDFGLPEIDEIGDLEKEYTELRIAAVNACKHINPDNPLAVAKVLPELLKCSWNALQTLKALAERDKTLSPITIQQLEKALKQATE